VTLAPLVSRIALAAPANAFPPAPCAGEYSAVVFAATKSDGNLYSDAYGSLHSPSDVRRHPRRGWYSNVMSYYRNYMLTMQDDGNLVLYAISDAGITDCGSLGRYWTFKNRGAVWSSNTAFQPHNVAVMQSDGNLVIYVSKDIISSSGGAPIGPRSPCRSSSTGGVARVTTDLQPCARRSGRSRSFGSGSRTKLPRP
jgi:hypothetical protein